MPALEQEDLWCSVGGATAFEYPRCVRYNADPKHRSPKQHLQRQISAGAFDPRYGRTLTRAASDAADVQDGTARPLMHSLVTDVRATLFESESPPTTAISSASSSSCTIPAPERSWWWTGYGYDS